MRGRHMKSNQRGAINGMIFVEHWPPPRLEVQLRHNCVLREVRISRAWDIPWRVAIIGSLWVALVSFLLWVLS